MLLRQAEPSDMSTQATARFYKHCFLTGQPFPAGTPHWISLTMLKCSPPTPQSAQWPSALTPGTQLAPVAGSQFSATSPAQSLWALSSPLWSYRSFLSCSLSFALPIPPLLRELGSPGQAPPALTHIPISLFPDPLLPFPHPGHPKLSSPELGEAPGGTSVPALGFPYLQGIHSTTEKMW